MKTPVIYRAASRGKVFTRNEKIAILNREKSRKAFLAKQTEMILEARSKAKAEKEAREAYFRGLKVMEESPTSRIKSSKDGFYIQPRINGAFLPKVKL